jgi:precorrin-2 dehydrogenase/sirohydrochlorin ferrochelatase
MSIPDSRDSVIVAHFTRKSQIQHLNTHAIAKTLVPMIPLFVDCAGKRIVIFGGGKVAARKAAYFCGEAKVLVVSRSFSENFCGLDVDRQQMDVAAAFDDILGELINGAFLVIGALSDPGQNNRLGGLCRVRDILFNNADGDPGDVTIPSITKGKNFTLAICTCGSSPAVSRFIREALESEYPALDTMIGLQAELREHLRLSEPSQHKRTAILREILNDNEIWTLLAEDPAAARARATEKYLA